MVRQGDCENKWLCCCPPYRTEKLGKPMATEYTFISFGDEAGAWTKRLAFVYWRGEERMEIYFRSPACSWRDAELWGMTPLPFSRRTDGGTVPTNSTKWWSLSWEADSFSDIQETSRILWNLKCYLHVHKGSPPTSIMSQINPFHTEEVVTWTIVWWYSVLQGTVS